MKVTGKVIKHQEFSGDYRDKVTGQVNAWASSMALIDINGEMIECRVQDSKRQPVKLERLKVGAEITGELESYKKGRLVAEATIQI